MATKIKMDYSGITKRINEMTSIKQDLLDIKTGDVAKLTLPDSKGLTKTKAESLKTEIEAIITAQTEMMDRVIQFFTNYKDNMTTLDNSSK